MMKRTIVDPVLQDMIDEFMDDNDLTAEDVGDTCGVSATTIRYWRGRGRVSKATVKAFVKAYKIEDPEPWMKYFARVKRDIEA